MFQWFGFADSFKRVAFNLFNQCVDSPEDFLIGLLPVQVIIPGMI
jgi:hypothetical protein